MDTNKTGSVEILIHEVDKAGKKVTPITFMMELPTKINNLDGIEKQIFVLFYMKQSSVKMIMEITNLDEKSVTDVLDTVTKKVVEMF